MNYINNLSASSRTYSYNRKLDVKSGIIELNKVKIRINEGDSLQRICNKINSKSLVHEVIAKLIVKNGHTVISLSSSKEINILDKNNILNNIGTRIRVNLLKHSLVDGLILTELSNTPKAPRRYIINPYKAVVFAPIPQEEVNDFEKLLEPILPAIQEDLSEENDQNNTLMKIAFNPYLASYEKMSFAKTLIKSKIPVEGETFVNKISEKVKGDSITRYKNLPTMAEKKLFFNQAKDFLRNKAMSTQNEKNSKYNIEQINRAKVSDVLDWYDNASPLKNTKDRWI